MPKRKKNPKAASPPPQPSKTVRGAPRSPESEHQTPLWSLSVLDVHGPFGWCGDSDRTAECYETLRDRLKDFEGRTWSEIRGRENHPIHVDDLGARARRRLADLRQDDIDELWSLRFGAKRRVWGIRDGRVLKLLWLDPCHDVYPVDVAKNQN